MITGIDVSRWQNTVNWRDVKNHGIQFAMIRAGYGNANEDPYFRRNAVGVADAGIDIGAYYYCSAANVFEASSQAEYFLNLIKGYKFTYPIALDIEDSVQASLSRERITDIASAFLEKIEAAGYYAILYASKYWLENKLIMNGRLKRFDVWLAQYTSGDYTYKGNVGMWQYTDKGAVNGIYGYVDMDRAYKDYAAIIKENGLNNLGGTHVEEKDMTLEEAKKIIQEKCGFDDNTMMYLSFYRYSESMILRLAKAMV